MNSGARDFATIRISSADQGIRDIELRSKVAESFDDQYVVLAQRFVKLLICEWFHFSYLHQIYILHNNSCLFYDDLSGISLRDLKCESDDSNTVKYVFALSVQLWDKF
ncbi:hypothetical protein Nepgr_003698 [Nepenthes gracilis]|uniref:Uncharacterized protein n=1 Tax=Nepenthes gracilis TaxID=150966 RepID=A0AAD3XE04_NEPGR|nr:hypothetical protein Nepgr_003698 [Nepenthes gracilis]